MCVGASGTCDLNYASASGHNIRRAAAAGRLSEESLGGGGEYLANRNRTKRDVTDTLITVTNSLFSTAMLFWLRPKKDGLDMTRLINMLRDWYWIHTHATCPIRVDDSTDPHLWTPGGLWLDGPNWSKK